VGIRDPKGALEREGHHDRTMECQDLSEKDRERERKRERERERERKREIRV